MVSNLFAPQMMKMIMRTIKALPFLLFFINPLIALEKIHPQLDFAVQDKYLLHLKSVFIPLTTEEKSTRWGIEYQIGMEFAKKLDLYQSITALKRADILIDEKNFQRKAEIQYQIINCYYLAKRYQDVVDSFEESILASTDRNFAAFQDLLVILFESYLQCDNEEHANRVLRSMEKFHPIIAKKLSITSAIIRADFAELSKISKDTSTQDAIAAIENPNSQKNQDIVLVNDTEKPSLSIADLNQLANLHALADSQQAAGEILESYKLKRKSPRIASLLNAVCPGAGYLYIGQKQSAFTAFCLNGLFIGTAAYFFSQGNYGAGIITTGFEAGWYFGGILGAKENTITYNERLFENEAHWQMRDHKLFPILMLQHGF